MPSVEMEAGNCLKCGELVDAATCIADPAARPSSGDLTICLYCGHLMAFANDLRLRDLTEAERNEVADDQEIARMLDARERAMR